MCFPMQRSNPQNLLTFISKRLQSVERSMEQRSNMLAFLVVRLVLMSGMAVGFSWWALNLSP